GARLADDGDVVLRVEERTEAAPHECLVIGEDDADHRGPPIGMRARTRNPRTPFAPASSSAPSACTRSCIPVGPLALVAPLGTGPRPSSSTRTTSASGS